MLPALRTTDRPGDRVSEQAAPQQPRCKIPSMSKVLAVTQLCETYGEIVAVDGVSFVVGAMRSSDSWARTEQKNHHH